MSDGTQFAREACERWGFPVDGGAQAGARAVDAILRADAELDILFPDPRQRLQDIIERQAGGGVEEPKDASFVFGLCMQAMFAVTADARKAGGVV